MIPRTSLLLLLSMLVGCAPVWTPVVEPARIWSGEEAQRVLTPCTRRSPGPVDSVWVPDSASLLEMERRLPAYLQAHWPASYGGTWYFAGEMAGFYSAGRRFIYGSYDARRASEPAPVRRPTPFAWCDGGYLFFGVVYDVADSSFVRLDPNEVGGVRTGGTF